MKKKAVNKKATIEEICLSCKASGVPNIDEILLSLCFRTEKELSKICSGLNIEPIYL